MSAPPPNRLARAVAQLGWVPAPWRGAVTSWALGRVVPLVGTAGLRFEALAPHRVAVSLRNRRRVQNHIAGVHAAAMALLAETATGFCVGMNVPDDKLLVIKTMRVDFVQRAQGDLRAVAELSPQQVQRIQTEPRGEVEVPVCITDAAGQSPIRCQMVWAWLPKAR